MTVTELAAPGTYPVPQGRGRWRFTLHRRVFTAGAAYPADTGLGELVDARGRRLETAWDTFANLLFTVDGHSPTAANVAELTTDVIAWRWDDQTGADIPLFRGPVCQSEDQIADSHIVNFVCHDYGALVWRRYLTAPAALNYTNVDQDDIVVDLLARANRPRNGAGADVFWPGSALPLAVQLCNPDGTVRTVKSAATPGNPAPLRVRAYTGGSQIGQLIDDLAKVISGYDYDVLPRSDLNGVDYLRVFYPAQGIARNTPALIYGSTVASLTRSVNSSDYANYVRVLGNNASTDPNAAQLYAEAVGADANNVTVTPVGLWMNDDNAADVNVQATLNEQAQGDLNFQDLLVPSYSLALRPGAYSYGNPNLGDTVPLVVNSGRLNVSTSVRVLGIVFDIGDDGDENVTLTVGRPANSLANLLTQADRDVKALARR